MKLYDDLTRVFSKDWFCFEHKGGIIKIEETEKQATVKGVELEFHGQAISIHKGIFEKTDFLFKRNEDVPNKMPKLQHSCDGVLIIEQQGQKYLVFIELKSDYTSGNIRKAEIQLCASYLRMMALLNCMEDFQPDEYRKCGIIVSHPQSPEELNRILKMKNNKTNLTRFERQSLSFASKYSKGGFPMDKTYSLLGKLPIADHLRFDTLPTFHFNVNKDSGTGRFALNDILKRL